MSSKNMSSKKNKAIKVLTRDGMDIFIKNNAGRPLATDKKRRAWAAPVAGAPSIYRNRNWPYKGRRTRVKVYKTASLGGREAANPV